jgi:hypothetical protein
MRRYDSPDPRLASPIEPSIKEPCIPNSDEPWRTDWQMLAVRYSANCDDACFQAFGGAI